MLEGGSGDNSEIAQASSKVPGFGDALSSDSELNANEPANKDAMTKENSGGIVVARGTGDGLILRLDGRVERSILLSTLLDYVESRKSFFSGQEVTMEWVEARPEEGVVAELSDALAAKFQLLVKASRMFERNSKSGAGKRTSQKLSGHGSADLGPEGSLDINIQTKGISSGSAVPSGSVAGRMRPTPVAPIIAERAPSHPIAGHQISTGSAYISSSPVSSPISGASLFDGVTALNSTSGSFGAPQSSSSQDRRSLSSEALLWDEPDTRIIRETLRGGQKIESEHSVLIVGDVNSGAEIVAGGDIFVLGRLRGVAHAGAYDESGGGRKIFSLQMQPTQLRIGSIISQGSEEGGRMPEMAKIEGNMIVVEPYGAGSQVKRLNR